MTGVSATQCQGAIQDRGAMADLVTELAANAPAEGANPSAWPGLTFYRFTRTTSPDWGSTSAIAVGIVAHGDDAFDCVVIGQGTDGGCRPFAASPDRPCLCLRLDVDPALVGQVAADMMLCNSSLEHDDHGERCVVTSLDGVLVSSVVRFLRALSLASDRQILAPLYLQEMVYRVLQRDTTVSLVRIADCQIATGSIAVATDYIAEHLAEPLTVADLARLLSLSPSAFSRQFREVTGRSPYQFVKEQRMIRARDLLAQRRLGVAAVARTVGYPSLSHFIKAFRTRFGCTPGEYGQAHSPRRRLVAPRTGTS